jgi:D-alanyl-D-alanine carboxypeptidase
MNKQALDKSLEFIGSWLQFRYQQEEIPGFAVAIAHKGKLVFSDAYGYADLESKTKLTTSHIFRIASHSKTFTATALMQLQEAGKLRIDDYVVEYLPWLKEHKDSRWQKVTLRQLMSHGAGVIRDGLNADYWQLDRPFPSQDELRREILEAELVLDTNIKLKYSNFGYSLLGMVIEVVSGQPYNEYVTENIVKALGLDNTGPEYTTKIDGRLVTGYSGREIEKTRLPIAPVDTHAMASATGFYSTAEDLCTYFSAHMVGSKKLLTDESKKEMQRIHYHAYTPGDRGHTDYGLGLDIEFVGNRKVLGHGGGFPGHITKSMFDPKDELVVVVLTNCLGGPATPIAKGIYGILDYYQKNISSAKPKHDLSLLEGRYMNLWNTTNIVVTGDKVVATYPDTWEPFTEVEELERVNDTTLKVLETNSFYSEGELVDFSIKNGVVESINYNGASMWPEAAWRQRQESRKAVELK